MMYCLHTHTHTHTMPQFLYPPVVANRKEIGEAGLMDVNSLYKAKIVYRANSVRLVKRKVIY